MPNRAFDNGCSQSLGGSMPRLLLLAVIAVAGCTSVTVRPVDKAIGISHVCIQENLKVVVADFVNVVRDGFDRHGISSEVFSGAAPTNCEYLLTYTATRKWDFTPYLAHAELRLEKAGRAIGYAEYHLTGGGGLDLSKSHSSTPDTLCVRSAPSAP